MKTKTKIITTICALTLSVGIAIPTLAAGDNSGPDNDVQLQQEIELAKGRKAVFETKQGMSHGEKVELTDEQKAELEAKRTEMETKKAEQQKKWASLTDEQKSEIYALHDQLGDVQGAIADKYAAFGLIDSEDAAAQKARIAECKTQMRENNEMPIKYGFSGKHMSGKHKDSNNMTKETTTNN